MQSRLPIIPQPHEQQAYISNLVQENEFNAFCVDCQNNRSTHANITFGTFICGECALEHAKLFTLISYPKPLEEVWDPYQLQITAVGGNQKFYNYMQEYHKEREPLAKKYKTDAAAWYRKKLYFEAKGLKLDEKQPPRNAQELAERTAEDAQKVASKGLDATKEAWNSVDQKYKIVDNTTELANKTKTAFMGLFTKAAAAVQ